MSIFKVKPWWSNSNLKNEDNLGFQNANCLKIDRFISYSDSDSILIGEGSFLKIYKPSADQDVSHTILETEFLEVVLQIETGKFIAGIEDRLIIVLHPQSYAIYQLKRKEGHTDAGDQNLLDPIIKHSFTRRADSLTCGPFGNIKTRDFICIQGLDGSLSFFDQDIFLFMCIFNDVIIPGPVCYISNCDSFIICKSTWILEIYSYQQLREISELTIRQNKNNIPQWTYNAGEEITHIQVIQTSNNFSSILALGERHLYCFQDNGLMKYAIRFEFMPICFTAYLIGWYYGKQLFNNDVFNFLNTEHYVYEAGARLLVMVASEDSKLFIYEGTTLLWSCDFVSPAISISRCFLKSLSGGLVTLSAGGIVNVGYIGTEPDLNGNVAQMVNETVDLQNIHAEMEEVEEKLQNILENKDDTDSSFIRIEHLLKIKADVGKPVQNLFQENTQISDGIHLLMCPIIVILNCEDPKQIQSVQITYVCCPPFECSESTICLDTINGSEIIETQIFLSSEFDISESRIKILFTITDSSGKIVVITRAVLLPLSLFCYPVEAVQENTLKLCVEGNRPCIELAKIFTDFTEEDLKIVNGEENATFAYRSTKQTVTIKSSSNHYFIEADEFTEMSSMLDHFLLRLSDHHQRMGVKDFRFKLKYDKEFVKQVMHKLLRSIEAHAKERTKLKTSEDELNILQRQFILVQKQLLVQYGSLPPGDCDPLEFLMRDTHKRIVDTVNQIIEYKENVCRAGSTVTAVGYFIICVLKQTAQDDFKIKLVEEMMTLTSLYEHYQEWEEAVAQALSYIWNNVFKKSEKDKEKLAPVMEQAILSQINLKRFLKQLRIVLDNLFSEADIDAQYQITRIEELVEVL